VTSWLVGPRKALVTCISWMQLTKGPYLAGPERSPLLCCIVEALMESTSGAIEEEHKRLNPEY